MGELWVISQEVALLKLRYCCRYEVYCFDSNIKLAWMKLQISLHRSCKLLSVNPYLNFILWFVEVIPKK